MYSFFNQVRQDDALRNSFIDLAKATFGLDFTPWYNAGSWTDLYLPQVLTLEGTVVSNVSVNQMRFRLGDTEKTYLQLGTVMTHPDYRNQGLNRQIMERVLDEYRDQVDGIYLFANDSVLDYYPKFGFRPVTETEYFLPQHPAALPYQLTPATAQELYDAISAGDTNPNDGFYMSENLGLYRFWGSLAFGECIYRIPEVNAMVIAEVEDNQLRIHQIIGTQPVDLFRLAASFGPDTQETVFCFTPADTTGLRQRIHKEEDTTLFILGEDLSCVESRKLLFPTCSHA